MGLRTGAGARQCGRVARIGDFLDGVLATLAAETSIAVFRVAFSRWVTATEDQDLHDIIRETLDRLRTLTASR